MDPVTGLLMINGKPLYVNAAMPAYNVASSPIVLFGDYSKAWNVLNAGLRLISAGNNNESPALSFLTRELIVWTSLGQSAGLSSAVKALVTASSLKSHQKNSITKRADALTGLPLLFGARKNKRRKFEQE